MCNQYFIQFCSGPSDFGISNFSFFVNQDSANKCNIHLLWLPIIYQQDLSAYIQNIYSKKPGKVKNAYRQQNIRLSELLT